MKKLQDAGFRFAEVPVHHFHRAFGHSQFFNWRRLWRTGMQLIALWIELVWRADHRVARVMNLSVASDVGREEAGVGGRQP